MITVKTQISDFETLMETSWSGAKEVLKKVEEKGLETELMEFLESLETEWEDRTNLNDFIWFDLENYEPFDSLWD